MKKLTAKEAAEILGCTRATIANRCRAGKFPNAVKTETQFGEFWEIPEDDLKGIEIKMGRPKKKD
jgi:predicted site-specific integrase-resolvase